MLLDDCSSHHLDGLVLKNIELEFLMANYTSLIQPLDQGIINSLKYVYCKAITKKVVFNLQLKIDKS